MVRAPTTTRRSRQGSRLAWCSMSSTTVSPGTAEASRFNASVVLRVNTTRSSSRAPTWRATVVAGVLDERGRGLRRVAAPPVHARVVGHDAADVPHDRIERRGGCRHVEVHVPHRAAAEHGHLEAGVRERCQRARRGQGARRGRRTRRPWRIRRGIRAHLDRGRRHGRARRALVGRDHGCSSGWVGVEPTAATRRPQPPGVARCHAATHSVTKRRRAPPSRRRVDGIRRPARARTAESRPIDESGTGRRARLRRRPAPRARRATA